MITIFANKKCEDAYAFSSASILSWWHTCLALEVFAEERGIGEVQFVGYLGDRFTGVHEFHLNERN